MEQKKPLPKKAFYIAIAILVVFSVVILVRIGVLLRKNDKLNEELAAAENVSEEMEYKNAALEAMLDEENESLLMEQNARDQGYVYPDEHVYINGN